MPWITLALIGGAIMVGGLVTLVLIRVFSPGPGKLGVIDGQLTPCPSSPNCVCSRATDPRHAIQPLAFEGNPLDAWVRLRTILGGTPRVQIVRASETYLHAEFRSRLFRFVDDVEFQLDEAKGLIHFRSASRAGRSDLGVNRKRMEAIRQAFNQPGIWDAVMQGRFGDLFGEPGNRNR